MPDWTDRVRDRLRGLHLDAATEAETIEELTQHLDDRYRDLRAIGMPDSEATAQAWRELEGHPRLAQEISRARVVLPAAPIHDVSRRGVAAIWDDVVFAWRRLRHAPGFAVVALITITLTVGANTAILSVADAVLFRPLPYADPDGVSIIQMRDRKTGQQYTSTPYAFLQAINEGCPSVSEAGLIEGIYAFPGLPPTARATVDSPEGPVAVPVVQATANYFELLGARPARGRLFRDTDLGGEGRTAVLTHSAWVTLFGADESIPGRTVRLGDVSFDVVGVLPKGFVFPSLFAGRPSVIVLRKSFASGEKGGTFHAIVRTKPGVSRGQAQAEVDAVSLPAAARLGPGAQSLPFLNDVRAILYPVGRPIMRLLLAATAFIFFLGCANLANMMLVRGRRSLHETAVRLALGASRARLIRPILFEAVMLGAASASLALALTSFAFDALLRQVPAAVYGRAEVGVDLRVATLAFSMGLLCALTFSLVPAWRASGVDVLALIQRRGGHGSRVRFGRPLVALQVAIAVAVVFGAAIAGRAFVGALMTPLGFSADRVVVVGVSPPAGVADRQGFYQGIITSLSKRPDVVAAGAASALPFSRSRPFSSTKDQKAGIIHTLPGYLEAASIRTLHGKTLSWEDVQFEPLTGVASASAAQALFGSGESAIGQVVETTGGDRYRIVGVVADVVNALGQATEPQIYALPGKKLRAVSILARVRQAGPETLASLKREVRDAGGTSPQVSWWSEDIAMNNAFRDPRFQMMVLSSLAVLALGLTSLGIFSVVGYLVAARMREMGVRLAIGASPKSLVALVIRQALAPVAIGIAGGVLLIAWGKSLAEAQLFKVDTSDPAALTVTIATVVVAALAAAYVPARRATRVNPTEVLRAE
jgi:predicted permease